MEPAVELSPIVVEIIKIFTQLGGASLVAWLTVRWALKRFKAEKAWERQLGIYTDLISSLRKVLATLGRWRAHLDGSNPMDEKTILEMQNRYSLELERISEALSAGLVLLPEDQAMLIARIEDDLNDVPDDLSTEKVLEREITIISTAFQNTVQAARKTLGTNTRRDWSKVNSALAIAREKVDR